MGASGLSFSAAVFSPMISAYDANVLYSLNIENAAIPECAAGVEIELDYAVALERAALEATFPLVTVTERQFNAATNHIEYVDREVEMNERRKVDFVAANVCLNNQDAWVKRGIKALAKWDGSVGIGYEFATEPLPFERLGEVASAYGELLSLGGRPTARCGLHVHINRAAFKTNQGMEAWTWMWRRYGVVLALSGRSESRLERWAMPQATSTALFLNWPTRNINMRSCGDHYSSVCFRRCATAELRVFAAPRTEKVCRGRLDLVRATVDFIRACQTDDSSLLAVSWPEFTSWLTAHRADYADAAAYVVSCRRRLERYVQDTDNATWPGPVNGWPPAPKPPTTSDLGDMSFVGRTLVWPRPIGSPSHSQTFAVDPTIIYDAEGNVRSRGNDGNVYEGITNVTNVPWSESTNYTAVPNTTDVASDTNVTSNAGDFMQRVMDTSQRFFSSQDPICGPDCTICHPPAPVDVEDPR